MLRLRERLGRDAVAGLVGLVVSVWLFALTWGMPKSPFVPIGPDFYPRIVLAVTALLSLWLIATDLTTRRRRPPGDVVARNYGLVALTFLAFGLYVLALPGLGFRIATLLFVAGLQVLLDPPRTWPRRLTVAAVALVVSFGVFPVFERYLSVLLPRGTWTGF
ncbi:tripartite tricarboxylate transporter TctB family protein [Stella humosa]|uniref:Tripartite tricarboxylate transporter TctB family protein n=1 Tax=Stella humosa TaxID=94 RepID=A0A3N1LJW6_9PROT|nr:tripartite tricarboxylate transporter TctB family protein [Stella humosa]ROP90716.1 tripartite tricarboxylate transporter TctB family protein [Stella humosa]